MPSWRFFDAIGPSPRVDYAWVAEDGEAETWHEFRPRPARVSVARMFLRLLWNPSQNENLYIVRCAERVVEGETDFPVRELRWRLLLAWRRGELAARTAPALCFRVRAVYREDGLPAEAVVYMSSPFVTAGAAAR